MLYNTVYKNLGIVQCIRQHQKDILEKVLMGQDCLFVAPTGSGKSFIFEAIPPALQYLNIRQSLKNKGNVVVVSPLISLMRLQAYKIHFLLPFDKAHTNHSSLLMFKDDFPGVLSVFWGELLAVFGIAP